MKTPLAASGWGLALEDEFWGPAEILKTSDSIWIEWADPSYKGTKTIIWETLSVVKKSITWKSDDITVVAKKKKSWITPPKYRKKKSRWGPGPPIHIFPGSGNLTLYGYPCVSDVPYISAALTPESCIDTGHAVLEKTSWKWVQLTWFHCCFYKKFVSFSLSQWFETSKLGRWLMWINWVVLYNHFIVLV